MLFKQLTNYNIHIGHKYINTNLLASWMLFKIYNTIWLINLYKTVWFFKLIFNFIKILVSKNSPIWFINSEMSKQYIINQKAIICGEFYCGFIWKRGLLSNYRSMLRIIKNIMVKRNPNINSDFYFLLKTWYLTRFSWPRAIFVSNLKNYNVISKEAFTARVPVIGMIDTNIKNFYVNFPIPSNDDSLISLAYISSIISKYILLYKYKKIILWYLYNRSRKRYEETLNAFESLDIIADKERIKRLKKIKLKKIHFNKFNLFHILKKGIKFLFKRHKKNKKKKINFFVENEFEKKKIQEKSLFFFNLIQLCIIRKKKITLARERRIKLNKKFFKINLFKLESRMSEKFLRYNYYSQKWYFFYYFLYFLRFFKVFIGTYEHRSFSTFSKVSLFYDSANYYFKKRRIYNRKNDTWFVFRRFYNLLKKFNMLSFNFNAKNFYEKLKVYKILINWKFKKDFENLKHRPKYILTNLFPEFESFRNQTAKKNKKKYVKSFALNLKKIKNIYGLIEKELYITLLVKFLNKNTKIYKNFYGNRKNI